MVLFLYITFLHVCLELKMTVFVHIALSSICFDLKMAFLYTSHSQASYKVYVSCSKWYILRHVYPHGRTCIIILVGLENTPQDVMIVVPDQRCQ